MAEGSPQRKLGSIAIPPRARPFNHSHCLCNTGHEVWRMQIQPLEDHPFRHTSCPYRVPIDSPTTPVQITPHRRQDRGDENWQQTELFPNAVPLRFYVTNRP
jgi:hypothetical protein